MNRTAVLALAAALAAGPSACDKVRPVEQPAANVVAECARCHGYPPPPFVAGGSAHTTSTRCSVCHPATVAADDVTLIVDGLHMNGVAEADGASHTLPFGFEHAPAALADIDSCRVCHGEDLGGGTAPTSCNACHASIAGSIPDWKTNCTFCHGTRTAGVTTATREAAPPESVLGETAATDAHVGAHQAHLTQGSISLALPCTSCHAVPTPAEALTHFTGGGAQGGIAFGTLATKGVTGGAYAGGTCSVYCHGSGAEFPNPMIASPAWTSTGITCTGCHGMPPASGPDLSGASAHALHVGPAHVACSTCHPTPPGQLATHVNGVKEVVIQPSGGGALTLTTGWDCTVCHAALGLPIVHPLPFMAQHTAAAFASISSCTGCHGADYAGESAQSCNACHQGFGYGDWQTNCTFCHGTRTPGFEGTPAGLAAPPQTVAGTGDQTAASPKVGAHQVHAGNGAAVTAGFACTECHPAATSLAHIGGSGTAQLAWGTLATDGGTVPFSMTSGTCATYCHGVTLLGGPAASPAWTSAAALGCASCHGFPPGSHGPGATQCSSCHSGTANTNGTIDLAGGLHVNGAVEGTRTHAADWYLPSQHGSSTNASGLSSCKSCHGASLAGDVGPSCAGCHGTGWDTSCTFCHGNPSTGRASPPVDTQGRSLTSNVSVGVHASHVATTLTSPLACTECHPARTASVITDTAHMDGDGIGEVSFGALARTGGAGASYQRVSGTSATCSATYCHGEFTGGTGADPSWTSTAALGCASCHGFPPGSHGPGATQCSSCHSGTVNTNGTIDLAGGLHVNGAVESTRAHAADWSLPSQHGYATNASGLSSCKSCHGASLTGDAGPSCAGCHGTGWDTSCTFCHGNPSTGRASPPVDTRGGSLTSNVSVGVHASHVATTLTTPLACTECHPARTASVITDAAHMDGDGIGEVSLGTLARTGGAGASYQRVSGTSATCSATYCHGEFTGGTGADPSWTSTAAATCTSCHPSPAASGDHFMHRALGCAECHGHAGTGATHVNGAREVPMPGIPGALWNTNPSSPQYRTCGSFTCHLEAHISSRSW